VTVEKPKLAYSVAEAAAASGLSESTIRAAYRSGALPVRYPTKGACKPVVLARDLQAWLDHAPTEAAS
jgi:hypothetical protein